jgi:hypothetical protein
MNETAHDGFDLWADDPESFSSLRISPIGHRFHDHPLMQLPRLNQLARDLFATEQCRFVRPGVQQDSDFVHKARPEDGSGIDEVFARISEPGAWVALYNIEVDPDYRRFLNAVVDAARPLIEKEQSGIHNVQGFLFISAPPSCTPFHIDRENNLWLQMRGRKVISVWDDRDRQIVASEAVEKFIMSGALDDVRLTPGKRAHARDFVMTAGMGVYFPTTSPHMTSTESSGGDPMGDVSVSVGVVFYTDQTRRTANAHILNHYLRKIGLRPMHAGESVIRDQLKYPFARLLVWIISRFREFVPKPGINPIK